ncbi:MAG TPA: ABC transporter substrate-binding protein [Thermoanaerobaculia bacterium]|nr:ABC transporter substrate-binding protein [Thermoanaerobaculia bacterium]
MLRRPSAGSIPTLLLRTRFRTSMLRPIVQLATVLLPMLALALVGCGGGDGEAADPSSAPIKVGAVFDLTGPTSDVGTTYSEGIRGYVDWLNQRGGIDGRPIELLYQDYAYKVDQAEQLYSQFTGEDVVAFQGWGTGDTEALRGRIADDHIPFMSASLSHVLGNPDEAPYNFLSGTSYTHQIMIVLDWLVENGKTGPVALMHNPSPFGLSPFQQGGQDYARSLGIELIAHEMSRAATDYSAELTRIAQSGAETVVFQNTSGPVAVALKNARDLGLDLNFACLNWCTNEVLIELAGEAAEGVLGSVIFAPPGEGVEGLEEADAYLRSKNSSIDEKGLLYGQGWWVMALMTEGIRRAAESGEVTGESIKAALETLDGYETGGVTAPVTYTPTDHRGIKGMRIFQVQDGKWAPLTGIRTATGT